jgi:hypothetical protein
MEAPAAADVAPADAPAEPASAEAEEDIDYDALSFTDPRYWAHFYDEDEELDFYEARRRERAQLCAAGAASRRQHSISCAQCSTALTHAAPPHTHNAC